MVTEASTRKKLAVYDAKRDFAMTKEPRSSVVADGATGNSFMIHKHDATRLHYDIRLETEGVLASWACPKGPSYDPSVKRLAVETEDHPLAYGGFEGRIPDGQYGAGDSLIWDRGTYETVPPGKMIEQRKKGHIHVVFNGEKLKGGWHLVRTRPQGSKAQWLCFKAKDGTERADYDVIAERPESVRSGRKVTRAPERLQKSRLVGMRPEALLAKVFPPMLATLSEVKSAPENQFVYEVKYDGYRALCGIVGKAIAVKSRNDIDFMQRFPFLTKALSQVVVGEAVIDGEIIALDEKGVSSFENIQASSSSHQFVAFDLLWLDGRDLREVPLEERRELLESLLSNTEEPLVLSERVDGPADAALALAKKNRWEGVIAKRRGSLYSSSRSTDWLKLKVQNTAELAIIGFTAHTAKSDEIGALLLATMEGAKAKFAGKVGTGFDQKMRRYLHEVLSADATAKSVASDAPRLRDATWVTPRHVAQLKFSEWTRDGKLRHPSFQGLREDKAPEETAKETPFRPEGLEGPTRPSDRVNLDPKTGEVATTHPEKVMFPKLKYTKADVREYIDAIASVMVPSLDGRPLSFQQFPQGIAGHSFFRHDATTAPKWVTRVQVTHHDKTVEQLVVDKPETLSWLANQSALTLHMPSSRKGSLEQPDWVAFDFDPVDDGWKEMIILVKALHGLLDELKMPSVPKTSGKRGIHVFVPIAPGHTHEQAIAFANGVSGVLAQKFAKIATVERMIRNRHDRLYIDAGQNGRLKTMVAPYSIRALEEASVSTPIEWDEVSNSLNPRKFTIKTVPKRVAKLGDLFAAALNGTARLPDLT